MMKTDEQKRVLRKLMILCWAALIAMLSCMQPEDHRLDTPGASWFPGIKPSEKQIVVYPKELLPSSQNC